MNTGQDVTRGDGWGRGVRGELTGSDDVALFHLLPQIEAAEEEGAQVDSPELALQHHLGHSSPHGGGLLEPVAAEACGKVHVGDQGVGAHHAVLVKGVVVVVAGPSAPNLQMHEMLGFSGRLPGQPPPSWSGISTLNHG